VTGEQREVPPVRPNLRWEIGGGLCRPLGILMALIIRDAEGRKRSVLDRPRCEAVFDVYGRDDSGGVTHNAG